MKEKGKTGKKPSILLIGTGGTIASVEKKNGLAPGIAVDGLLKSVPEIGEMCSVECIQLFSVDSTNIRPAHWVKLAECIRENYGKFDGFVITHGTDTMAYTASALSYMIQNSAKPIVLTGAQIPMGERNSDGVRNLTDSFIYACDGESNGVHVVFSGSVICGTRAKKNYTKRLDAFDSVNYPVTARIQSGRIFRYITDRPSGEVRFSCALNSNVGLMKLTPGTRPDVMKYILSVYDGVIIESFGVGGIPEYSDFGDEIKSAVAQGKTVILTTQVPNEGSDIAVYQVGNVLKKDETVLEAYDMTVEAVYTKLMWVLECTRQPSEIKRMFYTPVHHDIIGM